MPLAELQALFASALRGPVPAALLQAIVPAAASADDRLAIYRRTSRHAQRMALQAVYPVVQALIGPDLFHLLVEDYLRQPGSQHGNLHRLGADFDRLLQAEPACAALFYLPDVARLEWALHDSFFAADAADAVLVNPAELDAAGHDRVGLVPHPSLRLLVCGSPAQQIWQAHQPEAALALEQVALCAAPAWLAVHRRPEGHCMAALSGAEHDLLLQAQQGVALSLSLARLETAGALPDLAACLPRWLQSGLLQGFALR